MATQNCWRCLLRPSATLLGPRRVAAVMMPRGVGGRTTAAATVAAAPFSSAALLRAEPSGNVNISPKFKSFSKKKKKEDRTSRKSPAPGERKAFRKRIQLSNSSALPVSGLGDLTAEAMADQGSVAKMLRLPESLVDQLRAVEAFKPTQTWGFFREPHTLVRAETVRLAQKIQKTAENKEMLRLVITGDKISGKSTLLLQGMAQAFLNDWIVFNIPEAQELTTACTEYAPIPNTDPVQYMQPVYALNMLRQMRKASERVLQGIKVLNAHPDLAVDITTGSSTLLDLVASAKEAEQAWPVLQALWAELLTPAPDRRPIMIALDGLSHIMKASDYRSPSFELIHSHDLALVRRFVDALSGASAAPTTNDKEGSSSVKLPFFPAGGAVLAATSKSNAPKSFSMELALKQREAEQRSKPDWKIPKQMPYFKDYDARVDEALRTVSVLRVRGLRRPEARALMEYWAASGVLRAAVDEKKVVDVWTLGGHGNIGEMERAALLNMAL